MSPKPTSMVAGNSGESVSALNLTKLSLLDLSKGLDVEQIITNIRTVLTDSKLAADRRLVVFSQLNKLQLILNAKDLIRACPQPDP